ncbi:hypothetical protein [Pseudomonas sp. WS 5071]|uniref:hypothetical protein n=1 Tax=Pseudomonas sp. WS 5071 TaxID=2717479 RepID=UPI0014759E58|nr:hypothetical protein [Pseudomonas sp. WS 5071]NMY73788.1 hypothetical protein [Pseudomonas sp. WS 5071]
MNQHISDPLAEWKAAIRMPTDLITDPDEGWKKLVALAKLAHVRRQVDAGELSDMLEISDAARLWALVEWEEAYLMGLFLEEPELNGDKLPLFEPKLGAG